MEQQSHAQPLEHEHHHTDKKDHGFFSLLGKIFVGLLVASLLLFGGYYFGIQTTKNTAPSSTSKIVITASPTPIPPSPTSASQSTKTVKAGLTEGTSFKPYSIKIPTGWIDARENTQAAGIDKLTITKTGYSLTIYQAAFGGGGCIYKGDKPSQMAQEFTDFAEINGQSGKYRRSWNQEKTGQTISYTVCQQADDTSYGSLTSFGGITVVSPNPGDASTLAQIDGMIASLVKQ